MKIFQLSCQMQWVILIAAATGRKSIIKNERAFVSFHAAFLAIHKRNH